MAANALNLFWQHLKGQYEGLFHLCIQLIFIRHNSTPCESSSALLDNPLNNKPQSHTCHTFYDDAVPLCRSSRSFVRAQNQEHSKMINIKAVAYENNLASTLELHLQQLLDLRRFRNTRQCNPRFNVLVRHLLVFKDQLACRYVFVIDGIM
jgi:hypothetical protein